MNRRNLVYIYPHNQRCDFPLADNKLKTKELLQKAQVPHPQTYATYEYFYELNHLEQDLAPHESFVIKPASGSGGGGIKVIAGKDADQWVTVGGQRLSRDDLRAHISDIVFGIYAFDLHDAAIVEERIAQHPLLEPLSPLGLADIRLIMWQQQPVLAMIRLPTQISDGKANLHQGALGVGIDIATGRTNHAIYQGKQICQHPDTGLALLNITLPYWIEVLAIGQRIAECVPLKYLGVDIALSHSGPVVLEINVRPGIEIQNANLKGMRQILETIESP